MLLWGFNMVKNTVPDYRLLKLFNGFHRRSQIPARGAAHRKNSYSASPPHVFTAQGETRTPEPLSEGVRRPRFAP
jgi:hypothetical protein